MERWTPNALLIMMWVNTRIFFQFQIMLSNPHNSAARIAVNQRPTAPWAWHTRWTIAQPASIIQDPPIQVLLIVVVCVVSIDLS